jgi:hypothetical protein
MTAREVHVPWECEETWLRFERLEEQHRRLQAAHDLARRELDRVNPRTEGPSLRHAWNQFYLVVTQLGETVDEIARLQAQMLAGHNPPTT